MAICTVLWPFGLFYSHLVCFTVIGIFCGYLVYFMVTWLIFSRLGTKKNLATLYNSRFREGQAGPDGFSNHDYS
jgi:hypothetical protein